MSLPKRNREMGCTFPRKGKLAIAAVLMSALLTACGGGGDGGGGTASGDSSAATHTSSGGSASAGGSASVGGSANSGGSASSGGSTSSGESGGLAAVASAKGSTTLTWQPPTENDDGTPLKLTGFRIYWGLTEGYYPNSVTLDNPGLTRHVIEQLAPATYYFVATALSKDGESEPSNVIAMKIL